MSSLQTRQRALARSAIVDACASLVAQRHQLDFSMREVAAAAGVSLRTVYNHFETREDLLDALGAEFEARMAELGGPEAEDVAHPEDLLDAVRTTARIFEEMGGISEAFAQMPLADIGRDEERRRRTQRLVEAIAEQMMPGVPRDEAEPIAVLVRHVLSHRSWFWLTREYGLNTEDEIALVSWAITTLTDAAERGDRPQRGPS